MEVVIWLLLGLTSSCICEFGRARLGLLFSVMIEHEFVEVLGLLVRLMGSGVDVADGGVAVSIVILRFLFGMLFRWASLVCSGVLCVGLCRFGCVVWLGLGDEGGVEGLSGT